MGAEPLREPRTTGNLDPMRRRKHACQALTCSFLILVLAGCCALSADGGVVPAAESEEPAKATGAEPQGPASLANPAGAALAGIKVYFKLDPELTRGLYLGDRWVSPRTYTSVLQPGKQATVEARTEGQDARGRRLIRYLSAEWLPADPDMVTVSPGPGNEVRIIVHHAGESAVEVKSGEISTTLSIRATYRDQANRTQVAISREDRH